MILHVTTHAIERYTDRVEQVSDAVAVARLTSATIQAAANFGARFVRLPTGHRVVIENGAVVTVLPAAHYRKQIHRTGLSRYGKTLTAHKRR